MPTKLRDLKITRVDLVDKGADLDRRSGQGAHVVLYKRDGTVAKDSDTHVDGIEWACPGCGKSNGADVKKCSCGQVAKAEWDRLQKAARGGAAEAIRAALEQLPRRGLAKREAARAKAALLKAATAVTPAPPFRAGLLKDVLKYAYDETGRVVPQTFAELDAAQDLAEIQEDLHEDVWLLYDSLMSILISDAPDKAALVRQSLQEFVDDITEDVLDATDTGDSSGGGDATLTKIGRKISAARLKKLRDAIEVLQNVITDAEASKEEPTMSKGTSTTPDLSKLGTEIRDYITSLEKRATDAEAAAAVAKAAQPEPGETPEQVIEKIADPAAKAVAKQLLVQSKASEQRAKDAEAVAKAEKDARQLEGFVQVAKSFKHIAVTPDDDAKVFLKMAQADNDGWKRVLSLLKSADEIAGQAKITKARGSDQGGDVPGGIVEKVQKAASEVIAKDGKIAHGDAVARVLAENPEWYEEYRRETAVKVGGRNDS